MSANSEVDDKKRALRLYNAVKIWSPDLIASWNELARKPTFSDADCEEIRNGSASIKGKIFLFLRKEGYVNSYAEAIDDLIRIEALVAIEDGRMISPFFEYLRSGDRKP